MLGPSRPNLALRPVTLYKTVLIEQRFKRCRFTKQRVRATRGYATPATQGLPPPFALENSLTDIEKKTPNKQTKKKVRAGPGTARKLPGRTDRCRKQNPQTTKQNKTKQKKKKKKRSVLARAVLENCPDNSRPIGSQAPLITSR
jgi:hypothetical protein